MRSISGASTTRRSPVGGEPHHRPGLVDEIDGAVGQAVVAKMAGGELGGGREGGVGVGDAVMGLVPAAQAGENPHRLLDRWLVDGDLLQPPGECAVLLDLLELLEGRRADDAKVARGENRLDQRREIHRAAGDRAGADSRMDLVDEEDRLRSRGERLDDGLEPLLEIATEAGSGQERSRVERKDLRVLQRRRGQRPPAGVWRALQPWRSCPRRHRRRTRDCSCGGGTGPRSCAAAHRCGR